GVALVPGDFAWDDLGDFDALAEHLVEEGAGADDGAPVLAVDAQRPLVLGADRAVAVVGLDDVVVVQTPDALLVTTRAHAQAVKDAAGLAREAGREDLV